MLFSCFFYGLIFFALFTVHVNISGSGSLRLSGMVMRYQLRIHKLYASRKEKKKLFHMHYILFNKPFGVLRHPLWIPD